MSLRNIYKSGFTIVEILIVAPIVILVIGVFVSTIVSMTGEVLATRAANSLAYNTQNALNLIEQDVKLSGAFLATNNITLQSGQGYDNGTTNFHNADATNSTMLLNAYTTTNNPLVATRGLVYAIGQPNLCNSTLVNQNLPVMMNIVYFVKDNTLWRRIIMPSFYATVGCSLPWQQPSCVPGYDPLIYPFCKTQDMRLVDGIASDGFNVEYFPSPSSTTANDTASNDPSDSVRQTALLANSTVGVTITATNTTAGRDISQSGVIRAISPNNNTTASAIGQLPQFSDGFESGNFNAWSSSVTDGGDLSVTTGAKLRGSYGMLLTMNDATAMYVTDGTPANESRFRFRIYLDPNTLSMSDWSALSFIYAYNSGAATAFRLYLWKEPGLYRIQLNVKDDSWGDHSTANYTITDAPHFIEVDFKVATSAGANNGYGVLYIDGASKETVSSVDNDTRTIDYIQVGAPEKSGSGTFYIDDFASNNDGTAIGF